MINEPEDIQFNPEVGSLYISPGNSESHELL